MARNLPWNRDRLQKIAEEKRSATVKEEPKLPSPAPRREPSPERRSVSTPTPRAQRVRSPSTSPPPEPLNEAFMIEGMDADDRYRMVEDELAHTAGRFTTHLHRAEYHRLKQQVKMRNADAIDTISRPVVGRMGFAVRAKQERLEKMKRRKHGLRKALTNGRDAGLDAESEDEAPWMGTSLQGLMETPQKADLRLSQLASAGPSTRAAAGLDRGAGSKRSQGCAALKKRRAVVLDNEATDDDDLDAPARSATLPVSAGSRSSGDSHAKPATTKPNPPFRHPTWPKDNRRPSTTDTTKPPDATSPTSDSDDDLFSNLRRRRQKSKTSRPSQRRSTIKKEGETAHRDDIIPPFLP